MSGEVLSILLLTAIHAVALPALFLLMGRDIIDMFRMNPNDGRDGGEPPASDPSIKPGPSGGGLPLPDAEQSPVRLREPGRLGDKRTRPGRRPEHEPQRAPERV